MDRWRGRPALVTGAGASAGIGAGIVRALVKHGMKVAACDKDLKGLQDLKAELKDCPGTVLPIQCDLRKEDEIMAMFVTVKKELGGVDVFVNNAGLGHNAPLLTGKTEDWREIIEVNMLALCICTREAVQSMRDRNVDDGHVFLMNSLTGHRLFNKASHFYGGSKAAVCIFTEGLRRELREIHSHIRVTAISPGMVYTEFQKSMYAKEDKEEHDRIMKEISSGPTLTADDIVGILVYSLGTPSHVQIHDVLVRPTGQDRTGQDRSPDHVLMSQSAYARRRV